jgi:hypothetical protein
MKQKQRPIILEMDEAKQELVQCVNDILTKHRLSCYLIEPMFAEMYSQIRASAQNELAQARASETQMAEQNATQVEDGAE